MIELRIESTTLDVSTGSHQGFCIVAVKSALFVILATEQAIDDPTVQQMLALGQASVAVHEATQKSSRDGGCDFDDVVGDF